MGSGTSTHLAILGSRVLRLVNLAVCARSLRFASAGSGDGAGSLMVPEGGKALTIGSTLAICCLRNCWSSSSLYGRLDADLPLYSAAVGSCSSHW